MSIKTTLLLAVFFIGFCFNISAQQTAKITPSSIGYLEYLPQGYNSNLDLYPIVISLHGIGEKGTSSTDPDLLMASIPKVANAGLPKYVKYGTQYPFILISPQLKSTYGKWTADYVMSVLNHVRSYLRIDENRIYLTGLSLGGGGVWTVASSYPDVFASVVPICSGYNSLSTACTIAGKNLPVWAFHGDNDQTVSYTVSEKMVNAINACTPKPDPLAKFTIFPGMGHLIWDKVYKETTALTWMLGFSKGGSDTTPENELPNVNAGADQTVALPVTTATLEGSASDPDGTIASYTWTKVMGASVTLSGTNTSKLVIADLAEGSYTFRLTVKDNDNASKYDDVKITVAAVSSNKFPVANAGGDQIITLPTKAITLVGSGADTDGTISTYQWTQVSGPAAPMENTTTRKLWTYNLVAGTYVFRLTVKDNDGASDADDVKLTVNPEPSLNKLPVASAGSDQTITYPIKAITLVGSASDADGTIESYQWTKVSGPNAGMSNVTTRKLWAYDLIAGTYIFRLTVRDNSGGTAYDDVTLTVNGSTTTPNVSPTVSAGNDQSITLPTKAITLVGSASDSDGTIASYNWTQISGPAASMLNTGTRKLWAYNLAAGTYVFRLTVRDDDGAIKSDDVKLVVSSAVAL
jgi:predicted esterase